MPLSTLTLIKLSRRTALVTALLAVSAAGCSVTTTGAGSAASTTPASPVRTQGVTATSVRLGVAGTDPKQLKALGIPTDGPSSVDLFQAWVDAQNAAGGINGRKIELVFRPFLPTGPAAAQAACVELSEDKKVFAAIGILTGDTPLCFTETHQTAYIGLWGQSAERDKRSVAPFLAIEMADDRQRRAAVAALLDKKLLQGKKVALYWEAQDADVTATVVQPLLTAAGITVVTKAGLSDFGGDQAAADQALNTIVAKMKASGADTVLNTSNFSSLMVAFQRNGWLPTVFSTSAQGLSPTVMLTTGIRPDSMRAVTIAAPYLPPLASLIGDTELQKCVQQYNAGAATPKLDPATTSRETLNGIANSCAAFRVFVLATTAAGADLTTASFGRGAESLGHTTLPGVPIGSLGPGKHSVGDAIGIYTFDPATNQMVPSGPPIAAPAS